MKERGLLMVISGPSGAGKGTIVNKIMQLKDDIKLSISCTTRPLREGEIHGVDYYFMSHEDFDGKIANNGFLEYAEFVDNKYGTPKDRVLSNLEDGYDSILEIEVKGAAQIKKRYQDAVLIFIAPPSMEELKSRLIKRGTESELQSKMRLKKAAYEISLIPTYDYIVVNDDVDRAANQIIDIISAEKRRIIRNENLINLLIKGERIQ